MVKLMIGPPHYSQMLHPMIKKNYGRWSYHEHVAPGVIKHMSNTGDVIFTVRAGIPKFISVDFVRDLCNIADKYSDGYIKFTSRHNAEFIILDEKKMTDLINEIKRLGLPVGGTGNSFKAVIHTVGQNHCHTAVIDAPSLVKAISDEMYNYFMRQDLPAKLKVAVACCLNMCGAVHCSDIALVGMHRTPPMVDDEIVSKFCEMPTLIASCPTLAIKPKILPDKRRSVEITEERCMYCGNCYTVCPGLKMHNPEYDCISLWAGGKVSNAKSPPMFSRLVIPYIPNNPPRYPEAVAAVKKIADLWIERAEPDERLGEWIERIGWEKFFKLANIPFTSKHIDDFTFSIQTFRTTTQFKY